MKGAGSSETLVPTYQTTQNHITQDYSHDNENLSSQVDVHSKGLQAKYQVKMHVSFFTYI
jgi:hypothetical protein